MAIAMLVALVAIAAPARAWCEASCVAPSAHTESTKPHCPTHDPSSGGTQISASDSSECPAIEAARPVAATLAVAQPAAAVIAQGTLAPLAPTFRHAGPQAPRHPISVPLRI